MDSEKKIKIMPAHLVLILEKIPSLGARKEMEWKIKLSKSVKENNKGIKTNNVWNLIRPFFKHEEQDCTSMSQTLLTEVAEIMQHYGSWISFWVYQQKCWTVGCDAAWICNEDSFCK